MHPTPVSALRSVEIGLPDVAEAERFYTETWNLSVAARSGSSVYLRGAGSDHHLLSLHRAERAEVQTVTFRSPSVAALDAIAQRAVEIGGTLLAPRAPVTEPG